MLFSVVYLQQIAQPFLCPIANRILQNSQVKKTLTVQENVHLKTQPTKALKKHTKFTVFRTKITFSLFALRCLRDCCLMESLLKTE